jgi:hypothetical protein
MNRRDFLKTTGSIPVGILAFRVVGTGLLVESTMGISCNPQSVITTINGILTDVGPALSVIIELLPLLGVKNIPATVDAQIQSWITKGEKDVAAVESYITQYQSDLATNKTFQTALASLVQTSENDVDSILTVIQVLDTATRQKIENLVNAIGGALISADNFILQLEGKTSLKPVKTVLGKPFTVKNGSDFKKKYTVVLHTSVNDPVVDNAAKQVKVKWGN